MRIVHTAVRIAATLLVASLLGWGPAALADKPEPFEKGTGKYILVLKDSRTEVDDPVTGKKKAKEPDVTKHGGKVLYKKDGTRVIKLPAKAARALAAEENVAYLQRIWLGEPAEEWDIDELASSIKADSVLETQEINLTWETGQYQYDGSGNIKQIGDDTYVYDTLGRLKTAVVNGLTATYQYDSFGNLVGQTVNGVTRSTPVDASSNRLQGETYDAAGNLTTQEGTPVYNYDSFSMIDQIDKRRSGTITQQRILYGPDDERIAIVTDEGVLSRWKIRDFNGKVLREYRANDDGNFWQWMEDYVYGDGRLLGADRHDYYGGQRHFHLDHLGTVRMITDQNRQRISVHEFYPFGVEQTDATQEHNRIFNGTAGSGTDHRSEPMKFTSHERDWHGWLNVDNDEYLDYMHARYYDPNLGRFLSVDPSMDLKKILPSPQRWNRYSYVSNNPINKLDPDGREENFYMEKLFREQQMVGEGKMSEEQYWTRRKGEGVGALIGVAGAAVIAGGPPAWNAAAAFVRANPQILLMAMGWGAGMTGAATPFRVSNLAPDWVTKGFHIHVKGVELAMRPGQNGSIVFKQVFSSTKPDAAKAAIKTAEAALRDPATRRMLYLTAQRARDYLANGDSLARARSGELNFLMKALEGMGW